MQKPPDGIVACLGIAVTSRNRGVLALGSSLIGLIVRSKQNVRPCYLIGHNRRETVSLELPGGTHTIAIVPARMSPRSRAADHLCTIVACSLVFRLIPIRALRNFISKKVPWIQIAREALLVGDIRGGDSFSDIYGMRRFLNGFFMAWSIILIRGEIVQMPQTYGPFKSVFARVLARYLLIRSSRIIARDKESQRVAQTLIGHEKQVELSPDVAFSLEPKVPEEIECDGPADQREGPSWSGRVRVSAAALRRACPIGINVNGLMFNGGYTRNNQFGLTMDYTAFVPRLVETLLCQSSADIWLIPHTYGAAGNVESDPEACRQVHESLPTDLRARVRVVTGDYDCNELKGIIGLCDFFIGSRMHSCIAALSQGVPCVGVAYSMKFRGVFESVGLADWVVDARSTSDSDAISAIVKFYENRGSVRGDLAAAADQARARLFRLFQNLLAESTAHAEPNQTPTLTLQN